MACAIRSVYWGPAAPGVGLGGPEQLHRYCRFHRSRLSADAPLGLRFAPRIRDLGNTKLHIPKGSAYQALQPMIGGVLKLKVIQAHLDDTLRPTTSIKPGWRPPHWYFATSVATRAKTARRSPCASWGKSDARRSPEIGCKAWSGNKGLFGDEVSRHGDLDGSADSNVLTMQN